MGMLYDLTGKNMGIQVETMRIYIQKYFQSQQLTFDSARKIGDQMTKLGILDHQIGGRYEYASKETGFISSSKNK